MDLQAIQRGLQADAILKKCGLDFKIEKRPLVDYTDVILNPEDDSILPSKTPFYGLKNMKSGEYIHNVKKTYVVSQNKDVVSQVLKGIRGFGNLNVDSGASLKGGRKIFMQLGIDGYSQFGNNDQIKRYITVIDSNDGSAGIGVGIGDTVKSCDNQFFHFYKQSFTKIRHCKSLEQKMEELPALITIAVNESMKMIDLYTQFESTVVSRDLAHRMVENIIGCSLDADKDVLKQVSTFKKNQMKKLTKSINYEMNQKGDNLWGLHNGVTRWTTHDRRVPKRKNGRIESLVLGSAYKENNKSLDFCKMQLAN